MLEKLRGSVPYSPTKGDEGLELLKPMATQKQTEHSAGSRAVFHTTQWNVVLAARRSDGAASAQALESLCRNYWYPIYAFIRRSGHAPAAAQDLTQGFFAHLLQRDWLANLSPDQGRFRTYLLHCLTHFMINEWKREQGPQRRPAGGIVPLEIDTAEGRYVHEPVDNATPETLFQRRWAAALVNQAKARLRAECLEKSKLPEFEMIEAHLGDRMEHGSVQEMARTLGLSEGALRVAIHRLRLRFRELLRETVAETLADPNEVDAEIRSLFSAWS